MKHVRLMRAEQLSMQSRLSHLELTGSPCARSATVVPRTPRHSKLLLNHRLRPPWTDGLCGAGCQGIRCFHRN